MITNIYQRAFEIVKKNKALWVFGLALVAFAGGGGSPNFSSLGGSSDSSSASAAVWENLEFETIISYLKDLFSAVPTHLYFLLGLTIVSAMIIGLVISVVVSAWARGAAIGAIDLALDNKRVSLKAGSDQGIRSLKDIIWLTIVPWLLYFLAIISAVLIIGILFLVFRSSALKFIPWLLMVIMVITAVLVNIAISAIQIWAQRIVVIEKKTGKQAFFAGWQIVKKHFFNMLALGLANCFLNCCLGMIMMSIVGILVVFAIGIFMINQKIEPAFVIFIILLVIIVILFSVLVSGIYKIFNYSTWNILYRQIKEGKING